MRRRAPKHGADAMREFRQRTAEPRFVELPEDWPGLIDGRRQDGSRECGLSSDVVRWIFQNTEGYALVVCEIYPMRPVAVEFRHDRDATKFSLVWL